VSAPGRRLKHGCGAGPNRGRRDSVLKSSEWQLLLTSHSAKLVSVNAISRRELFAAADLHPETRQFITAFYRVVRRAWWRSLADVRKQYPSADLVGQVLVVNVLGNNFRMLFCVNFTYKALFFKGLFTHTEYDRLSLKTLCPR
jgi:mRNA interferase HigB